jgi:2-methylcitrate dehydratase
MSVARELANKVRDFHFGDIPAHVIHQTKRMMLDTLGCAIGGCESEASRTIQEFIKESGHPPESTVFGSGIRTSCLNATLANGAMVRYLDYNDTAFILQGETYRTGYHPSEVIPPVLALGEKHHLSGKDVIMAINLGYDLSLAFLEGVQGAGMEKKGWNGDTRGALIMPLVAGKILGLTEDQMESAVGIAGSCHAVFGILDTPAEEYTMTKNIRFPMMSYAGIMAAMLAEKGFTGPAGMIEGHDGFVHSILDGEYDLEPLLHFKGKFAIRETCIKSIIADFSSHGHLTATLNLVREHDIKPDQVAEIRITTSKRCAEHTGDPVKKYPKNKETADHSSYYLTAIAIVDRQIGPNQFTPEKYIDPRVIDLIGRVTLTGDPALDKARPAGISEIVTQEGKTYRLRVDHPRGHARNPMTDQEVIAKFKDMASVSMAESQMNRLIESVFTLDRLEDIGTLLKLMVF